MKRKKCETEISGRPSWILYLFVSNFILNLFEAIFINHLLVCVRMRVRVCVRMRVRVCVCVRACVRVCVMRAVCVVLVLLLCIIVYYFKGMYECVYAFVLHCIAVLYYYYHYYYITVLRYVRRFRTYMDLRHTNTILTDRLMDWLIVNPRPRGSCTCRGVDAPCAHSGESYREVFVVVFGRRLSDSLSIWLPFNLTPFQTDSLSNWLPFNLTPFQYDSLSNWFPFNLTPFQYDSLSIWLPFKLTPFQFDSLSIWLPFKLTPFQFDSLSIWLPFKLTPFQFDSLSLRQERKRPANSAKKCSERICYQRRPLRRQRDTW